MLIIAVKRLSGVNESGSERFELDFPKRVGASIETLGCVGIVKSVTSSSGRARGRTAAEVIVIMDSKIILMAIFGKLFEMEQLYFLTESLWETSCAIHGHAAEIPTSLVKQDLSILKSLFQQICFWRLIGRGGVETDAASRIGVATGDNQSLAH